MCLKYLTILCKICNICSFTIIYFENLFCFIVQDNSFKLKNWSDQDRHEKNLPPLLSFNIPPALITLNKSKFSKLAVDCK